MIDVLAPVPTAISIDYSTACNLRCTYCHTGLPTYKVVDMTPEMLREIYDFSVENGVTLVCTSANGETTFYPHWYDDLKDFLENPHFNLQINSNFARDFREGDLAALNRHDKIQLSIDSSSPELMKSQRTADLRTILSNVVRLKQFMLKSRKKTQIEINCTVTRNNITHIADLARLGLVLGVDAILVTEMMAATANPNMPDGIKDLTDDEAAAFVMSISEAIGVLEGSPVRFSVRPGLMTKLQPIVQAINAGQRPSAASLRKDDNENLNLGACLQPWQTTIVHASGMVTLCCGMGESVGNVREERLADIVNGEKARTVRQELLENRSELPCRSCWAAVAQTPDQLRYQVEDLHLRRQALVGAPV